MSMITMQIILEIWLFSLLSPEKNLCKGMHVILTNTSYKQAHSEQNQKEYNCFWCS